jgi:hypothetical protein
VQHYWSLSLEEQFYLVWPVVLFLIYLLTRRRSGRARTVAIAVTMGSIFVLSLAYSVYYTAADPSPAYFSTFTHAWEFALGGLLALASGRISVQRWGESQRARAVASWLGVAAILVAALTFSGNSNFPGWIALLPAFGAATVIAAGTSSSRIQRPLLLPSRAVQGVGGASYSIYLWHWPLIVGATALLARPLGWKSKLVILVASLALGFLTRIFVEDPARRSRPLNSRTWINYAILAAAVGAVVVSTTGLASAANTQEVLAQHAESRKVAAAASSDHGCLGALAMERPNSCPGLHTVAPGFGPNFAADDWGSLAGVDKDGTLPDKSDCTDFSGTGAGYLDCTLVTPMRQEHSRSSGTRTPWRCSSHCSILRSRVDGRCEGSCRTRVQRASPSSIQTPPARPSATLGARTWRSVLPQIAASASS